VRFFGERNKSPDRASKRSFASKKAICDDVGDDAYIVPKNYDKYRKTVGATLRGRPIFSPHPGFTFGKTHLPLKGKACRGGNLPPVFCAKKNA